MLLYAPRYVVALSALAMLLAGSVLAADEGFVPLFDGKTLHGWTQRGGKAKYAVEDGAIVGTAVPNTPNSFLCTEKNYSNFILELQFKVDDGLNSGVQVRSQSLPSYHNGQVHGYQVEIDPSDRAWSGGIYDEGRRGWLFDLKNNEPARKAFKHNDWNEYRIECRGDSIKTWINGVPAADLKDSMTHSGFIALQVHNIGKGDKVLQVRFRNLRLKKLAASVTEQQSGARPPNVILILVDDLGWTDLSCQGSKYFETPSIDRLAEQGMRFTNGYAACAVCSPTRAAIQTGRYPARVGITDWIHARFQGGKAPPPDKKLPEYVGNPKEKLLCPRNPLYMELDELTIAEALHTAGYVSCHIGKWHLGPEPWFPEKQGYDLNLGGCDLGQPPSYFDPYQSNRPDYRIPNLKPRHPGEYLTDREADEAVGFIRSHKDKPFFLNLCHYAVHTPLMAKKELIDKYEAKARTNQKNAVYAAMIQSVDESTARVMAVLDELKLAENTVVIFTSDNGGLLGSTDNAPLRAGKGYPYEGGIRVPLLVRWPATVKPNSVCNVPACSIDFFPTVLEIAGVPLPKDRAIDGVSLLPLLKQTGPLKRDALFWHFPHYRGGDEPYSIVRAGDWKLIRRWESGRRELFNLAEDLGETRNRAGEIPEKVRQLDERLTQWLAATGAKLPKPNPDNKL